MTEVMSLDEFIEEIVKTMAKLSREKRPIMAFSFKVFRVIEGLHYGIRIRIKPEFQRREDVKWKKRSHH